VADVRHTGNESETNDMTQHDQQMHTNQESMTDKAAEKVAPVVESAQERASATMSEVGAQSREMADQARTQMRSEAESQTRRLSEKSRELSHDLRTVADQTDVSPFMTSLARDGAQRLDRLSTRLEQQGIDGAINDVKRFARQRPGAFLAGCAGAGFLLGRILHNTDTSRLSDAARREISSDDHSENRRSDEHRDGDQYRNGGYRQGVPGAGVPR
jgi:ElaB/YqjD/DUF883 family membrane-anchored ribosome-binding protein